jgi:hypothetical protein
VELAVITVLRENKSFFLVDAGASASYSDLNFDGKGLSSGVCSYRMHAGAFVLTRLILPKLALASVLDRGYY